MSGFSYPGQPEAERSAYKAAIASASLIISISFPLFLQTQG